MELKEFVVGSKVNGLKVGRTVEIVAVKHHGDEVIDVTYKDANGNLGGQMVFADGASEMELEKKLCIRVLMQTLTARDSFPRRIEFT